MEKIELSKWKYCEECGVEWYSKKGTHIHFPMRCAYCGYEGIQVHKKEMEGFHFSYTEPDYGDGWKCPKCENTVTGIGAKIPIPIYIHGSGMGLSGERFQEWLNQPKNKCPKCSYEW